MKYWKCPLCGISNPTYLRLCQHCRYIRRQTDITLSNVDFWKCEWCGVFNVETRYICRRCFQTRYRTEPLTSKSNKKVALHHA